MKKKSAKEKHAASKPGRGPQLGLAGAIILLVVVLGIRAFFHKEHGSVADRFIPRPKGHLTFTKDISPIVFVHCSGCHRPGQSAPFSLLNYAEVKKHASDVATVTARRYMPPWLPESGPGEFIGDRRLSADQIGVIQQWVAEGSIEGLPQDLAPMPRWDGDWQLGTPDTVVTMPQPYSLVADGRDVYRNFVIPTTLSTRRFVRAVEFHPGNAKVVHHAFVKVDRTRESRRRDDLDAAPGFAGMSSIAEVPGGHFLGWQPGRLPVAVPEGLAWSLEPGDDLVVQMHLNPSGKPENVQASVGLYFTARPPTNSCFKILLTSYAMDIPAGASHYVVEDRYELPVDVEVLAVLPHAHYLAREMEGWATLPDGSRKRLLWIRQWDFNWQGDYRYSKPVFLPKGTALEMRFTYDNSTNNARNPQQPPQRVTYGLQSIDEMAELWFQVLAGNAGDLSRLTRDYETKSARLFEEHDNYLLRKDPEDAEAHDNLALRLLGQNKLREAEEHLRRALRSRPDFGQAHYDLGLVMRHLNRLPEARAEFETALRLNPQDFRAHGNLGFIALAEGDLFAARQQFENALHLNPDDAMARAGLSDITNAIGRTPK